MLCTGFDSMHRHIGQVKHWCCALKWWINVKFVVILSSLCGTCVQTIRNIRGAQIERKMSRLGFCNARCCVWLSVPLVLGIKCTILKLFVSYTCRADTRSRMTMILKYFNLRIGNIYSYAISTVKCFSEVLYCVIFLQICFGLTWGSCIH